jgi:hypothetical protein
LRCFVKNFLFALSQKSYIMPLWVFYCFLSEHSRDVMDVWYNDQAVGVQARFRTILQHLRDTPRSQWNPHLVCPITMELYRGLYEIRFQVRNVLYRPLGFFGPGRGHFTLLMPAREQGNQFIPRNALETARERMRIVMSDRGRICECSF